MIATILDIDGTLVDTNYQHTLAWQRALRELEAGAAVVYESVEELCEHLDGPPFSGTHN